MLKVLRKRPTLSHPLTPVKKTGSLPVILVCDNGAMKARFGLLSAILGVSLLTLFPLFRAGEFLSGVGTFPASVFFERSIATEEIIEKFSEVTTSGSSTPARVKILIVPGHDDTYSGTQFGSVKEATLNLSLAKELYAFLSTEQGLDVLLVRDDNGYAPQFREFLERERDNILAFRDSKIGTMERLVAEGKVERYVNVHHNAARPEVSLILYGINKFANDNGYDIVIHVHFNDYPGRSSKGGKYSGFTVYTPENQYSNASASRDLAVRLRDQLALVSGESDLPNEGGMTEDQELIAVGGSNTVDGVAVLIEYGYIYERQFTDGVVGGTILRELAHRTHYGVMEYVSGKKEHTTTFDVFDGYVWPRHLTVGDSGLDVLALQDRLRDRGYYPYGETLNECPLSGKFGLCTRTALVAYQNAHGIQATGYFGDVTRASLGARP